MTPLDPGGGKGELVVASQGHRNSRVFFFLALVLHSVRVRFNYYRCHWGVGVMGKDCLLSPIYYVVDLYKKVQALRMCIT